MSPPAPPITSATDIELVSFEGWPNNLRLANGTVELIITLNVGPRLLVYRRLGGGNPFKIFADQAGQTGETAWRSRGGHRFWVAPEDSVKTYFPDNAPVTWQPVGLLHVRLQPPAEASIGVQKEIDVHLAATGTRVTVVHRLIGLRIQPVVAAPWAITVMAPGGVAILPQPSLGRHPRDLLPNRNLVLWPYTDLSDPRWSLGSKYFFLRQTPGGGPTKLGLSHQPGWAGYVVGGELFLKSFGWNPAMTYPDRGCNLEVFSNQKMLELESLGPLASLGHRQIVEHVEHWELHRAPAFLEGITERKADQLLEQILRASHLPLPRPIS